MKLDYKLLNSRANKLQLLTLILIKDIFNFQKVKNSQIFYKNFKNEIDNDVINIEVTLKFNYSGFFFEFYLYPDKIEYFIRDSNGKIIGECNMEDFDSFDIMVLKFQEFLLEDTKLIFPKEVDLTSGNPDLYDKNN